MMMSFPLGTVQRQSVNVPPRSTKVDCQQASELMRDHPGGTYGYPQSRGLDYRRHVESKW